jgi:histidyl-tRNA synthetase
LKQYFKPFKSQLTELSQERLSSNPTRILDDKVDGVKDFVKNAPKISKFLTSEEVSEFKVLLKLLDQFNINYIIDETLVRGLDYYTNTVFEISTKDDLALGGGGRYGKLVEEFGGEETSCIGMAFGIDRIIDYIKENKITTDFSNTNVTIVFASLIPDANTKVLEYMAQCRKQGISCVANLSLNKLAKVFNYAEKINAKYVAIIGEAELNNNTITYKDIEKKIQKTVSVNEFFKLI